MQIHIATSGWFYREWQGAFYPDELPAHKWFNYYVQQFPTVELNAPFYHWPKPETVKNWRRNAPENFRYSVKVNRAITHNKKFHNTKKLVHEFYQIAEILGSKMGCFLFQLPPNFAFTPSRLKRILEQIDPTYRNVLEFRHASWWIPEVFHALTERQVTFCSISAPRLPHELVVTTDVIYARFHGPNRWFYEAHPEAELAAWAEKISASRAREAWLYFNNTADLSAIANARSLRKRFASPPEFDLK